MSLGDLEQLILLALVRLEGEAHGAAIAQEIEEGTGRRVSPGAIYTVLNRLENKRFVRSWIGDSTPDRGGRRRKVYRLLPAGAQTLRSWYGSISGMASGMLSRLDALADEKG
jgi:DNA-binding PadR family transcriptional regulator